MDMKGLLKNLFNTNPKTGDRFFFEMTGTFTGSFSSIKRIERKIARETYAEGGRNYQPVILAKQQTELHQLVLEKGFVKINPLLTTMQAELLTSSHIFLPGVLMVLDKNKMPTRMFVFENGIVSDWSMSDLEAKSPTIMLDSITVQHTGLVEVPLAGLLST
ncbi:phage tail protein [Desulfuribacillus alkaliarsenatis]|uniref:Phage tail protein n=1 Tax=Desulfuribacillus alkaliarsenatis TaxID=766136 RepID=A0A1E5G2K1_9FIRM|nr:phage tail protein [Desulfuribacillus alkaliarsenatis]OEF97113.1 hypothetical protein BHF68_05820 [Desulfuribacillus alkaliarsenatis]